MVTTEAEEPQSSAETEAASSAIIAEADVNVEAAEAAATAEHVLLRCSVETLVQQDACDDTEAVGIVEQSCATDPVHRNEAPLQLQLREASLADAETGDESVEEGAFNEKCSDHVGDAEMCESVKHAAARVKSMANDCNDRLQVSDVALTSERAYCDDKSVRKNSLQIEMDADVSTTESETVAGRRAFLDRLKEKRAARAAARSPLGFEDGDVEPPAPLDDSVPGAASRRSRLAEIKARRQARGTAQCEDQADQDSTGADESLAFKSRGAHQHPEGRQSPETRVDEHVHSLASPAAAQSSPRRMVRPREQDIVNDSTAAVAAAAAAPPPLVEQPPRDSSRRDSSSVKPLSYADFQSQQRQSAGSYLPAKPPSAVPPLTRAPLMPDLASDESCRTSRDLSDAGDRQARLKRIQELRRARGDTSLPLAQSPDLAAHSFAPSSDALPLLEKRPSSAHACSSSNSSPLQSRGRVGFGTLGNSGVMDSLVTASPQSKTIVIHDGVLQQVGASSSALSRGYKPRLTNGESEGNLEVGGSSPSVDPCCPSVSACSEKAAKPPPVPKGLVATEAAVQDMKLKWMRYQSLDDMAKQNDHSEQLLDEMRAKWRKARGPNPRTGECLRRDEMRPEMQALCDPLDLQFQFRPSRSVVSLPSPRADDQQPPPPPHRQQPQPPSSFANSAVAVIPTTARMREEDLSSARSGVVLLPALQINMPVTGVGGDMGRASSDAMRKEQCAQQ